MTYVGRRVPRVDAVEKVTGSALYGSDVALPGMLHGAVLRSPHAHARLVAIDTSRAQGAPGVRAIVTGRDFPFTFGASIQDQPFLAIDRVRFVGEPVVAVAADTELQAQEALDLVTVEYEELPAVLDARRASPRMPRSSTPTSTRIAAEATRSWPTATSTRWLATATVTSRRASDGRTWCSRTSSPRTR